MKDGQTSSIDTEQQYTSIPRAWLADIIDDTAASYEMLTQDIRRLQELNKGMSNYTMQTLYRAAREIKQRLEGYRRAYTDTDETDIIH